MDAAFKVCLEILKIKQYIHELFLKDVCLLQKKPVKSESIDRRTNTLMDF